MVYFGPESLSPVCYNYCGSTFLALYSSLTRRINQVATLVFVFTIYFNYSVVPMPMTCTFVTLHTVGYRPIMRFAITDRHICVACRRFNLSPFSPGNVLYNAGSAASFEQNVNETGRDLEWRETEDVLQDLAYR